MGCYRYQDVPTVPIEGLFCLMWDVPEKEHKRVVKVLRDRSLIESLDGKYWLHPTIKEEGRLRIKEKNQYWFKVHERLALFWQEKNKTIETIEETLESLETYFHHIEAKNYENAANSLLFVRDCKMGSYETLTRTCYRLGLFNQAKSALSIIAKNEERVGSPVLSGVYQILGTMEYFSGNIASSLQMTRKSKQLAKERKCLEFEVLSLLNEGFCKTALLEYQEAEESFIHALLISKDCEYYRHIATVDAYSYLAYLTALKGNMRTAYKYIDDAEKLIETIRLTVFGRGYSLCLIGSAYMVLGKYKKSHEMYNRSIEHAERSLFKKLHGNSLNCLGVLQRKQGNKEDSLTSHLKALSLFEKLDITFDIAETYYFLGLIYRDLDKRVIEKRFLEKSLTLMRKLEFGKQIERVESELIN